MALPNFDFTQMDGTQKGTFSMRNDFLEHGPESQEALITIVNHAHQANKNENDRKGDEMAHKENQMNDLVPSSRLSGAQRYVPMDQEDIQRLSQNDGDMAGNKKEEGVAKRDNISKRNSGDLPTKRNVVPRTNSETEDYQKSEANSAEETISMSASAPITTSSDFQVTSMPHRKESVPAVAPVSNLSISPSHERGQVLTSQMNSFDSGVAEAASTYSSIPHMESIVLHKDCTDAGKANISGAESIHASEVSTLLDTSKQEAQDLDYDKEGHFGKIDASEPVLNTRKGTRKLEQFHQQLREEREQKLKLRRQPNPNPHGGDETETPLIPRALLSYLDRSELYKSEKDSIDQDIKQLKLYNDQLPSVFIEDFAAQLRQKLSSLEKSIEGKQNRLHRFLLVSWISCDICSSWYCIEPSIVCDMQEFEEAVWSCGCSSSREIAATGSDSSYLMTDNKACHDKVSDEVRVESKSEVDVEEEMEDEILEEPEEKSKTDSETLVTSMALATSRIQPTSSQVLASDALINILNSKEVEAEGILSGRTEDEHVDEAISRAAQYDAEAELVLSQSQSLSQSEGKENSRERIYSRLHKTGKTEKKVRVCDGNEILSASPSDKSAGRRSFLKSWRKEPLEKEDGADSTSADESECESESEMVIEQGDKRDQEYKGDVGSDDDAPVTCDEHDIPVELILSIRKQRADLNTLQDAAWRKLINVSLVKKAGWRWRNSVGMETGHRMVRPGVTAKVLQHYEHYILDDEAPLYVSLAANTSRGKKEEKGSHKACFLAHLSEELATTRRSRRSESLTPSASRTRAEINKKSPSPDSARKKRQRSKSKDAGTETELKNEQEFRDDQSYLGKRNKISNRMYADYLDPDTQALEGMEPLFSTEGMPGRAVKYSKKCDGYDSNGNEGSASEEDEMDFEPTQHQSDLRCYRDLTRQKQSLTPQQLAAMRRDTAYKGVDYERCVGVEAQSENVDPNNPPQLFVGRRFCFSGLEAEISERLKSVVERRGGTLIKSIEELRRTVKKMSEDHDERDPSAKHGDDKKMIIISYPSMYKREKFLIGLANPRYTVMVHPEWLTKSSLCTSFLPVEPYILPTGYVPSRPFSTLPSLSNTDVRTSAISTGVNASGIFRGVQILDLTTSKQIDWKALLTLAGATVIGSREATEALQKYNGEDNLGVDVVAIADPDEDKWPQMVRDWYDRHCAYDEHHHPILFPWTAYNIGASSRKEPVIVSVEWVAQSLAAGVRLHLHETPLFSLFQRAEECYYVYRKHGVSLRYTSGDVVKYNTEDNQCLGKIAGFTHGGRVCKVIHIQEHTQSGDERGRRVVTLDPQRRSTLISSRKLLDKALVLCPREYSLLEYSESESLIYCPSEQWFLEEEEKEKAFIDRYFPRPCSPPEDEEDSHYDFIQTQGDW